MLILISPAKSLDFESKSVTDKYSQPLFLKEARQINKELRKLSPNDLSQLMSISDKLGELNFERNQTWKTPFTPDNAKQAILAFTGDVYQGLDASHFSERDFEVAQEKIRILSGLYGVLKPLDLIQPYRLEMGTKFGIDGGTNLYEFWQSKISQAINSELKKNTGVLVNLASNEYFKAVDPKKIEGEIISPAFKDLKNGKYKIISFYAKKARGLMSRFIVQNNISNPEDLKAFDLDGYYFNNELSKGKNWVFTRDH
ncbi:peroxide stress protein YaaA [uncultured Sunxiuqinia sp.]|uniref:peroxide stress protein YaaA n=1 Tax=uncultured Sunxiuqinia sp. TaxID=1573825 RepID=UPI00261087B6|nr:peroxide stress protein YaaA [uncultured Sunxiuqinia sp.]